MEIINFDFNDIKLDLSAISAANSAMQASIVHEQMERDRQLASEISRQSAKRDATLVAGAEASIEQKELLQQQLDIIREQNSLLCDNYNKLKEMYDAQVQTNIESKAELDRSKKFNAWMMVIAIVAMLAAIAGPIATILVST